MYICIIKNKFQFPCLLVKIFTKSNISKVIIIFTVGLISRVFIGLYYDVNVFIEYYKSISLIYYSIMAMFVVVLSEVFTYFDLNIIPSFIFNFYTFILDFVYNIVNSTQRIFIVVSHLNKNIYHLKLSDFSIKSISAFLSKIRDIFIKDSNKLTIGYSDQSEIDTKPFKTSNVLNKGEDNLLLPKTTYKPAASSSGSGLNRSEANKFTNTAGNSDKSLPFVLSPEIARDLAEANGSSPLERTIRDELRSSSVYSDNNIRPTNRYQDYALYGDSLNSNFNTPSTMSPLFGDSQLGGNSLRSSIRSNMSDTNYYPEPLVLPSHRPGNVLRSNSRLHTPSIDSVLSRSNPGLNNSPYALSGNSVLANVTFNQVGNVNSTIPLNNRYPDRILPIIPRNYESALDNIADTPRFDDPCSVHYQSKHRPQFVDETRTPSYNKFHYHYKPDISQVSQELDIQKAGLRGKVKLGFKSLGHKFSNGVNKIESAYVHYETVSKRHII